MNRLILSPVVGGSESGIGNDRGCAWQDRDRAERERAVDGDDQI